MSLRGERVRVSLAVRLYVATRRTLSDTERKEGERKERGGDHLLQRGVDSAVAAKQEGGSQDRREARTEAIVEQTCVRECVV